MRALLMALVAFFGVYGVAVTEVWAEPKADFSAAYVIVDGVSVTYGQIEIELAQYPDDFLRQTMGGKDRARRFFSAKLEDRQLWVNDAVRRGLDKVEEVSEYLRRSLDTDTQLRMLEQNTTISAAQKRFIREHFPVYLENIRCDILEKIAQGGLFVRLGLDSRTMTAEEVKGHTFPYLSELRRNAKIVFPAR